jgi:hypothetical protein
VVARGEARCEVPRNGNLAALLNFWERGKSVPKKGPIELQYHGDPLWFLNVYIKELPDEGGEMPTVDPHDVVVEGREGWRPYGRIFAFSASSSWVSSRSSRRALAKPKPTGVRASEAALTRRDR